MYLRDGSAETSFTCCHTEIEVADQTFYLAQSQYTDTGPTSPGTDPVTPGAWQKRWEDNIKEWTGQDCPTGNSSRRQTKRQTEETMGRQHQRMDWPRLSYREQFKEADEEADRGNDVKTSSKSGLAKTVLQGTV